MGIKNKFLILVIIILGMLLSSVTSVTSKEVNFIYPLMEEISGRCDLNKTLIMQLYEAAKAVEINLGIPALFQLAQAVLESGWDLKPIIDAKTGKNSFNIYGIKYHRADGNFVTTLTTEYYGEKKSVVTANFQAYKDYEDCFNDHANLLTKDIGFPVSYSEALEQYKKDKNLDLYIARVSKVYATDPKYANYIKGVIKLLPKETLMEKELIPYEQEIKEAEETLSKLGIMTDFRQPVTSERLAVILARLIKINFKSI